MAVSQGSFVPNSTDMVSQFMQHKAPEYHPAWGNAIAKTNVLPRAPLASPRFSQTATNVTEAFKAKMDELFHRSSNKQARKVIQKFTISGKHTWQDVQKEARDALNAYHSRADRSLFTRAGRAMGKQAPALQSWLELLPNDQYTSVACGALKLFFGAAAVIAKTQKQIQDTIEVLTDTVENASDCIRLYDDPDLGRKAEELYVAILEGTEAMIVWLDRSEFKEVMKAVFQQNSYGSKVEEKIDEIQSKAQSFANKLTVLFHERLARIEHLLLEDKRAYSSIENLLRAQVQSAKYYQTTYVINAPQYLELPPSVQNQEPLSGEEAIAMLNVDLDTVAYDMFWAMSPENAATEDHQLRAMHLLQHPRFEEWLTSEDSDFLVVHDMDRDTARDPNVPSAVTYLAGKLVRTITSLRMGLPLVFFCGRHLSQADAMEGGPGMMKSMNAQFLDQFRGYDASFIEPELLNQLQEDGGSRMQWSLFQRLVENTRPIPIFCIIDSLSDFDNGMHDFDIPDLVQSFQDLVANLNESGPAGRSGPILKLLITMPQMGPSSGRWFSGESIISVPESTPDMIEGVGEDYMMGSVQNIYGGRHLDRCEG